jgi:hypothetical protein
MNAPSIPIAPDDLAYCRDMLRQQDRERFFASLFMPQNLREAYWILAAFENEIVKVAEVTREAITAAIRLKWWQESLEEIAQRKTMRQHPVYRALAGLAALYPGIVPLLQTYLQAQSALYENNPVFKNANDFDNFCAQTGGALFAALALVQDPHTADKNFVKTGEIEAAILLLRRVKIFDARHTTVSPSSLNLFTHTQQRWVTVRKGIAHRSVISVFRQRIDFILGYPQFKSECKDTNLLKYQLIVGCKTIICG